ncbi:MAG: adenosylcobinamide-GDP ribazoletransferase [Lachnospiraceae bacterium]|nr:adenosylcobinamide-GDP ribazoletransferase [Lachnospiraceae bacterium]
MKLIRRIAVSLSLYSRIPVPDFRWEEDDMKNSLMFFPLVGVVIGFIEIIAYQLCKYFDLNQIASVVVMLIIPIMITGGFHLDGYMDTTDAIRSYRSREDKLRILKDPHCGAFAVIGLVCALLMFASAAMVIYEKGDFRILLNVGVSFVFSRSLSGLLSLILPKARTEGMLHKETSGAGSRVIGMLIGWYILALAAVFIIDPETALLTVAVYMTCLIRYKNMTDKEFGGVTGDTAGYFVTVSEIWNIVLLALLCLVR